MEFFIYKFNELTTSTLYEILRARSDVFVVEQNCVFQDIDNHDSNAFHLLMCSEQNKLVAYCRILPPGEIYEGFSSIGRVFTVKAYRYQKYGRQLMSRSIEEIKSRFPHVPIKIQAQQYLLQFYQSLGFEEVSESYLHDDILHVDMVLEL